MNDKYLKNILMFAEIEVYNMENSQLDIYAQEDGETVKAAAMSLRKRLDQTVLKFRKERLASLRSELNERKPFSKGIKDYLSDTKKNLLSNILSSFPEIGPALTFQNRNIESLSDEDIEIALQQLDDLGVLDDYLEKIKHEKS